MIQLAEAEVNLDEGVGTLASMRHVCDAWADGLVDKVIAELEICEEKQDSGVLWRMVQN